MTFLKERFVIVDFNLSGERGKQGAGARITSSPPK